MILRGFTHVLSCDLPTRGRCRFLSMVLHHLIWALHHLPSPLIHTFISLYSTQHMTSFHIYSSALLLTSTSNPPGYLVSSNILRAGLRPKSSPTLHRVTVPPFLRCQTIDPEHMRVNALLITLQHILLHSLVNLFHQPPLHLLHPPPPPPSLQVLLSPLPDRSLPIPLHPIRHFLFL